MTRFDERIKLNQMRMSWGFTRTLPMLLHFIETLIYIIVSQTQFVVYCAMVFSMYQNAGLISAPYPIAVFGWAQLEERRPSKRFWVVVRWYTTFLLLFKFLFNLELFAPLLESEAFVNMSAFTKFGLYDMKNLGDLVLYMVPEVLILCFIMLHEIKLQLIGLYNRDEEDVEPVLDGIERNRLKGDEEEVARLRIETQNMCMQRYFESSK